MAQDDLSDLLLLAALGGGVYWYATRPTPPDLSSPAAVAGAATTALGDLTAWIEGALGMSAAPGSATTALGNLTTWVENILGAPASAAVTDPATGIIVTTPGSVSPRPTSTPIVTPPTGAGGTDSTAPLATNTSNANGSLATALGALPVSGNLDARLDDATALVFREYAALNPADFQLWLERYADHIQLHDDMFFQAVMNPPSAGFELTVGMLAKLGGAVGSAGYKIIQAFNGVAVGNYGDLFGVTSSLAGAIPGLNPDFVHAMQGVAFTARALQVATSSLDVANAINDIAYAFGATTQVIDTAGLVAGEAFTGLAGPLMIAGLALDIGFTIVGNAPDVQKAIDVALDTAAIMILVTTGWTGVGIVVAIVIEIVKFIIDCFGADLFGGGLSAHDRDLIAEAAYSQALGPMFPQIANALTPRELLAVLITWGSGYCGGTHIVAMSFSIILRAGDTFRIAGQPYTVPADTMLGGYLAPGCYQFRGTPWEHITFDELAWALAVYGGRNGLVAEAQIGVPEGDKAQFNSPTDNIIVARCKPMGNMLAHGYTVDGIDSVVAEYRAQPELNRIATSFGYPNWQELLGTVLQTEWTAFLAGNPHGALSDFAHQHGYGTMGAFRDAALASYRIPADTLSAAAAWFAQAMQTTPGSITAARYESFSILQGLASATA